MKYTQVFAIFIILLGCSEKDMLQELGISNNYNLIFKKIHFPSFGQGGIKLFIYEQIKKEDNFFCSLNKGYQNKIINLEKEYFYEIFLEYFNQDKEVCIKSIKIKKMTGIIFMQNDFLAIRLYVE